MKTVLLGCAITAFIATSAHAGIFDGLVASHNDRLQAATTQALGNQFDYTAVTISEVKRGMTQVKWKAKTPSGNYICFDDDMMRGAASCIKDTSTDQASVTPK